MIRGIESSFIDETNALVFAFSLEIGANKKLSNTSKTVGNLMYTKQEHRTEMDARAGTFQALELFGQQLLQGGHYASVDIQEKLNNMGDARQELEK